jgi:PKD repeat protein
MKAIFLGLLVVTTLVLTMAAPADAAVPTGLFVSAITTGTAPFAVQFIDSSTGTPTSWAWSFGDGGTSAVQNPAHTYTSAGSYTVTLTVTNTDGSNTISKTGYITVSETVAAPVASFVGSVTSGTSPLTVQFADSSTNTPTSWAWSFGDGSTSADQNPSHTYSSAGSYTVTLTAINAGGSATASQSGYITVTNTATAPVTSFVSAVTTGTTPLTIQFADSSTNTPTSWAWSFGDGDTSTDQNPSHTYSAAGSYTVTLTATNTAGSNTVSQAGYITVTDEEPVAAFTSNVTTGTASLFVQFNDTSTNYPTSWTWYFGDGGSSTEQDPVYEYISAGTYTVTLTAANSAGSDTTYTSGYITVDAASVPVTSFTVDVRSGTSPLTVQFTDTSTNSPTSWLWSFGDGSSSTDQSPSHTYSYTGSFSVSLTAYNAAGSRTSSASDYITVSTTQVITTVPTTAIPVTTMTTIPVTALPEVTPWPDTAEPAQEDTGSMDLLILAGAVIGILGIAIFAYLKWFRGRGRYQRWDL